MVHLYTFRWWREPERGRKPSTSRHCLWWMWGFDSWTKVQVPHVPRLWPLQNLWGEGHACGAWHDENCNTWRHARISRVPVWAPRWTTWWAPRFSWTTWTAWCKYTGAVQPLHDSHHKQALAGVGIVEKLRTRYNSYLEISLLSPADQNNFFANSVDPDETAHDEPSHLDLYCLPFCFGLWSRPLFGTMVLTRFGDRRVHFRNSGMKGLKCGCNREVAAVNR